MVKNLAMKRPENTNLSHQYANLRVVIALDLSVLPARRQR
jgi:hypothetical protein